jgi:hypothetical protein
VSESQAAERLGRYQLLEPIGAGPNGSVWRAKVFGVAGLERQFAVKRISAELAASPAAAATLSAAARAYGSLEHPRIARMSEFGVAQGQTFTAVELVTGLDAMRLTADAKIGGTGLPAGGALALVSQIARAVGYAHGRGLTHLGLAPTNVIVTPDGDVKVTDFSILSATLPPRPGEERRLANRVAYLAPEQLAGEPTSAATDVFALGVIAYELVTGSRAYSGDSPAAIVQAVLAGPPPEPQLPRPIVRVLQRCLARSPFERFPDARALADALDAALRVAPVPGTRKDIGAGVKATLDRLAAINEGEMSGMLALNVGTGAPETDASTTEFVRPDVPVAGPAPLVGPRAATPPPRTSGLAAPPGSPLARIAPASVPAVPKATMTGLAPPPIPGSKPPTVPPSIPKIAPRGTTPQPPSLPPTPPVDDAARTHPGMARAPSELPTRVAPDPTQQVSAAADAAIRAASESMRAPSEPLRAPSAPVTISPRKSRAHSEAQTGVDLDDAMTRPGPARDVPMEDLETRPGPPPPREMPTDEMSPLMADQLRELASRRSDVSIEIIRHESQMEIDASPEEIAHEFDSSTRVAGPTYPVLAARASSETLPPAEQEMALAASPAPAEVPASRTEVPSLANRNTPPPQPSSTMPGFAPPARGHQPSTHPPAPGFMPMKTQKSGGGLRALIALLVVGAVGAGGYVAYTQLIEPKGEGSATQVADNGSAVAPVAKGSAAIAKAGSNAAVAKAGSNAEVAKAGSNAEVAHAGSNAGSNAEVAHTGSSAAPADHAGSAAVAHAGSADHAGSAAVAHATEPAPNSPQPTGASDQLQVSSKPSGARVFIDGADQGTTPVKLAGSSDRHNIALLLPGHDLYLAEVDGHGQFSIDLKAVTPSGGPAGIKVLKCKKDRYYVFVDGKPTGMLCPTERIHTTLGPHTVEVYDAVTESRQKFDINVPDDRLSVRVRIE